MFSSPIECSPLLCVFNAEGVDLPLSFPALLNTFEIMSLAFSRIWKSYIVLRLLRFLEFELPDPLVAGRLLPYLDAVLFCSGLR